MEAQIAQSEERDFEGTATYSPEDDKIRFYPFRRLPKDLYERVKASGFSWAPKQELFFKVWTPQAEDLALELCGEIDDEDKNLVERAEERADRFDTYSGKRAREAAGAQAAVARIANGIPLGQPILVGHHSERRARKDAEKIRSGMAKMVKLWETSSYWTSRAKGALAAAKYKERPGVRARRIKRLEAELRGYEKNRDQHELWFKLWTPEAPTLERAKNLANRDFATGYSLWGDLDRGKITAEEAQRQALEAHSAALPRLARWIDHLKNRLDYERIMLEEQGGIEASRNRPEVGGACSCWCSPVGGKSVILKVKTKSVTVQDPQVAHRTKTVPFDELKGLISAAQVARLRAAGCLLEAKDGKSLTIIRDLPAEASQEAQEAPSEPLNEGEAGGEVEEPQEPEAEASTDKIESPLPPSSEELEAMRATAKAAPIVVSAPELFPTPPFVVSRMVQLAELQNGEHVLEPSAGTGAILEQLPSFVYWTAVEINSELATRLASKTQLFDGVICADFLTWATPEVGLYDKILMNPPFGGGADVRHILTARRLLSPKGRLVGICANGPRQHERIKPFTSYWEELPAGTFAGTQVRTALFVINSGSTTV